MGPVLDYKKGLSLLGVVIGLPSNTPVSSATTHLPNSPTCTPILPKLLLSNLPSGTMLPPPPLPMYITEGVLGSVMQPLPGLIGMFEGCLLLEDIISDPCWLDLWLQEKQGIQLPHR